jgi:hypothetical protein
VLLTALFYAMSWVNVWLAFAAFGIRASFVSIAAVIPTAMLIAMVPISLGSLGVAEGTYVFYAVLLGVGATDAALMGFLLRAKILMVGVIGLLLYLSQRRRDDIAIPAGAAGGRD